MPVEAQYDMLPNDEGGYQKYKAAGKLQDKKAIITGGDSGIGRATAILFAMEGPDSLIAYLPDEEKDAQETKKLAEQQGAKCHLIATDINDRRNCQEVVSKALRSMGGIDILFNNAAFQTMKENIGGISLSKLLTLPGEHNSPGPEAKQDNREQWLHTFNTNIHPLYFLSKYSLPHMGRGATIINNASINAYIGRPDLLDYTNTKGAVVSFTRGLSNQYVSKSIRVNAVAPGPVWTALIPATMNEEAQKEFTSPMGRPAHPSEVATCVVFLASANSSAISGQTIHCNGGVIVNG